MVYYFAFMLHLEISINADKTSAFVWKYERAKDAMLTQKIIYYQLTSSCKNKLGLFTLTENF